MKTVKGRVRIAQRILKTVIRPPIRIMTAERTKKLSFVVTLAMAGRC